MQVADQAGTFHLLKIKPHFENMMTDNLSDDIKNDIDRACALHQRATSDYEKCVEFNKLMSELLGRLEDAGQYRLADRVMTILLDCNPKEGSSCEKSTLVGDRIKKFKSLIS